MPEPGARGAALLRGCMRLYLIAIGKMQRGPEYDLVAAYRGRLPWPFEIRELEVKRPHRDITTRKEQEADRLLEAIPDGAAVIALDETGKSLTSRAFASRIDTWQAEGQKDLALVIGGADGLSDRITRKADLVLGLGALTWPHMLVRVLVAEQVYRAWSILAGHPYHRD